MSRARLVITAVVVEGRPVAEAAAAYGCHRAWIYKLLARYRAEGEAAFESRSRRPKTSPSATAPQIADLVLRLRKDLAGQGLDAGPQTILPVLNRIARALDAELAVQITPQRRRLSDEVVRSER